MREQILCYAIRYHGEWHAIKQAILRNEEWERCDYDGDYVTIYDKEYPQCFLQLEYPPWILFYAGRLELCSLPSCAVIGSRMPTQRSIHITQQVVKQLADRYVIVSGLAKGIDAGAHTAACNKHTIGVIGCGLDVVYPKENARLYAYMKQSQLILSEYPKGTKPLAYHFPWRNRLIAALSDSIVVIEAKKRSGTLLTVNEALNLSKPIYCIPHAFADPAGYGCNLLISQGANILVDEADIALI